MKQTGVTEALKKKFTPESVEILVTLKSGAKFRTMCVKYEWNEASGKLIIFRGNPFAPKQMFKNTVLHVEQISP
ncbi:hypothetical protein AKL17_1805 [Frigidibacter mobilis]|uniref:Uncharacterized protein n=1 Tax=Frigidibacter mobilis TaxID=1335048 RepID=A0A159Z221_9RHOB|nr:hypothetical protein AKL17_1805 [Frigidibacter mobilis]